MNNTVDLSANLKEVYGKKINGLQKDNYFSKIKKKLKKNKAMRETTSSKKD